MKPIKINDFLQWCQDKDAAASLLCVSIDRLNEMIEYDVTLNNHARRLAGFLMAQSEPKSKEEVLRLALARAETKLEKIQQTAVSLDPIMDL